MAAPVAENIERTIGGPNFTEGLVVKQTKKGCFQEMLGCDANQEFYITTDADRKTNIHYATENSGFCKRLILGPCRPFTITVHEGDSKETAEMLRIKKPFTCGMGQACECCCHPRVEISDASGQNLGKVEGTCFVCNPAVNVYDESNKLESTIKFDCMANCLKCNCCKASFDIIKDGQKVGTFTKERGSLGKELFTDADTFSSKYPAGTSTAEKTRIIGATFLINQLYFEKKK